MAVPSHSLEVMKSEVKFLVSKSCVPQYSYLSIIALAFLHHETKTLILSPTKFLTGINKLGCLKYRSNLKELKKTKPISGVENHFPEDNSSINCLLSVSSHIAKIIEA